MPALLGNFGLRRLIQDLGQLDRRGHHRIVVGGDFVVAAVRIMFDALSERAMGTGM
jgi:hypothetical protein